MIRNYDKLIFELSKEGRTGYSLPKNPFKDNYCPCQLPAALKRESKPLLPEVTEFDVVRHYTNLSNRNFGVDTGFYPLGPRNCYLSLWASGATTSLLWGVSAPTGSLRLCLKLPVLQASRALFSM